MKSVSEFENVFIHQAPVDMRKGIGGLCDLVQAAGMGDIRGKNLFVFSGKRKHAIKVLYFDRTGFCLWQKKLDRDKFPWPKISTSTVVDISVQQFAWLLEGFNVWKIKPFADAQFEKLY